MISELNENYKRKTELEKICNTQPLRRLKYLSLALIAIAIVLLMTIALALDYISPTLQLVMEGCAGLCAIGFALIVAYLSYRANAIYLANKQHRKSTHNHETGLTCPTVHRWWTDSNICDKSSGE